MAAHIAITRLWRPLFQTALTSRCTSVNITRFVRRRRVVSTLNSVEEILEKVNITKLPESSSVPSVAINPPSFQSSQAPHLPSKPVRFGEVNGLVYNKLYPSDRSLTKLARIGGSKKLREHLVLLEGKHLICSALDAGAVAEAVYFSSVEALLALPQNKLQKVNLFKVQMEDPKVWGDLDTSQEVIAIFKRPEAAHLTFSEEKFGRALPLTLICDTLRDPGNLGAVLCSATAAGCSSVLLSKGCVDIWEPKVLRAAMGAHFRLPIIPNLNWNEITKHIPKTATVHAADNCRSQKNGHHSFKTAPQKSRPPSDYGWGKGDRFHVEVNDGFENYNNVKSLQTQNYYTDWVAGHTCIIIGGETHGLSQDALQLAERRGGRRLLIPMVDGMDSLNSAMAASVVLFEGRKQLLAHAEEKRV
ncbi:hypothetical protein DNTS_008881 [Danionella cerebrum]|uniref:tRNA/rRNA methyltransferase SpoU type domain-containing protein n=1 Tax=Danionella cerebrum TaxID=2873325 RepID=A0A553MVR3_9TELE|nr:hypothetical protein DNTS_008881 [Danionella translucida]